MHDLLKFGREINDYTEEIYIYYAKGKPSDHGVTL